MKAITVFTFTLLIFCSNIFAQANELDFLNKNYKEFKYSTVIELSNSLLVSKERFSKSDLIEIYTLKAASHYVLNDLSNSRKSFIDILKLDENFNLSTTDFSPKLVDFFGDIKIEFNDVRSYSPNIPENGNNDLIKQNLNPQIIDRNINTAIAKSIVLPGWGHLSLEDNTKHWLLTSTSTITLGSMVYFVFDTNKKEKDYLAAINSLQIQKKYDDYNQSYKIRNALIVTYAAIWLYSQIDLLFISTDLGSKNLTADISKNGMSSNNNSITLSLKFPF